MYLINTPHILNIGLKSTILFGLYCVDKVLIKGVKWAKGTSKIEEARPTTPGLTSLEEEIQKRLCRRFNGRWFIILWHIGFKLNAKLCKLVCGLCDKPLLNILFYYLRRKL